MTADAYVSGEATVTAYIQQGETGGGGRPPVALCGPARRGCSGSSAKPECTELWADAAREGARGRSEGAAVHRDLHLASPGARASAQFLVNRAPCRR